MEAEKTEEGFCIWACSLRDPSLPASPNNCNNKYFHDINKVDIQLHNINNIHNFLNRATIHGRCKVVN